jgi:hypothetical protein
MTRIGWEFTYEPFDGNGYIPDFIVHGERPLFIEVKPAMTSSDYYEPFNKVSEGLKYWDHTFFIVGASPIAYGFNNFAGVLGFVPHSDAQGAPDYVTSLYAREETVAWWGWCQRCLITTPNGLGRDVTEICNHERELSIPVADDALKIVWAASCNDVKWRGTAK